MPTKKEIGMVLREWMTKVLMVVTQNIDMARNDENRENEGINDLLWVVIIIIFNADLLWVVILMKIKLKS